MRTAIYTQVGLTIGLVINVFFKVTEINEAVFIYILLTMGYFLAFFQFRKKIKNKLTKNHPPMTEEQIRQLGFQLEKHYTHDEWETFRYKKGVIQIEFTYEIKSGKIDTVDVTIDEVIGKEMGFTNLLKLDRILN